MTLYDITIIKTNPPPSGTLNSRPYLMQRTHHVQGSLDVLTSTTAAISSAVPDDSSLDSIVRALVHALVQHTTQLIVLPIS